MRRLVMLGIVVVVSLASLHPISCGGVGVAQDRAAVAKPAVARVRYEDPGAFIYANNDLQVPVVVDYVPKVGDKLYARSSAVGFPTRDDFVARFKDQFNRSKAKWWHDWMAPHKFEALDRMRVVEVYPPDERLGINATGYRLILVEVETGRLRGAYRIVNKGDIGLPTPEGRAMIKD